MLRACMLSLALNLALAPVALAAYERPAAPGTLVDIGGRRLHVECKGSSKPGPTVIFEAGLSQYPAHSTYGKAQDLIAPFAYVCTYDRAGFGWSDPVAGARTQQDMVKDLHALATTMQLPRPLVLVGHSMGGLLVRLYAQTYPEDVGALVLVDASNETINFAPGAAEARKAMAQKIAEGLKVAKPGVPVVPMPDGTPPEVMLAWTPEILATVEQEYEAIDRLPAAMQRPEGFGKLGDLPLAIIRRGKQESPPTADDIEWRKAQEGMLSLSTDSFLVVAEHAGHVIPYDEPQVVADAVKRVLAEVDAQAPAAKLRARGSAR